MWMKFSEISGPERDALPDNKFAWIGPDGQRHLPIHDANHVRNALSRLGEVDGMSARDKASAMNKIKAAAKRYGVNAAKIAQEVKYGPGGNLDWDDDEEPDESEDGNRPGDTKAGAEKKADPDGDDDDGDEEDDGAAAQADEGGDSQGGMTVTDVHVPGPINSQKKRSPALKRLASSVRAHFGSGRLLASDQFENFYRKAIGGAGGVAKKASDPGCGECTCSECSGAGCGCCQMCEDAEQEAMGEDKSQEGEVRLHETGSAHFTAPDGTGLRMFIPLALSEDAAKKAGEWIQYLPKPGTWDSPRYGKIKLTRERNQRFVENFSRHVYQERLPIDAEHETKLSGAFGWIEQMRQETDGSVSAYAEWNEKGKTALAEKRFRYFSPEWYDRWVNPVTSVSVDDVPIGGAITTRPFFKESSLRPLVASEQGFTEVESEEKDEMTGTTEESTQFTELSEQVRKFSEQATQADEARQAAEKKLVTVEEVNVKLAERLDAIQLTERRRELAEIAKDFPGETAKHVALMETMTDEGVKSYSEILQAAAEQIKLSGPIGVGPRQDQTSDAVARVRQAAEASVKSGEGKNLAKAMAEQWTDESYQQYLEETGN